MESFIKGNSNTFSPRLTTASLCAPGHYAKRTPIVVAEIRVLPADASTNSTAAGAILTFGEPEVESRALHLISQSLGLSVEGPTGNIVTARDLEQTKPAQILVRAAAAPSLQELATLFPTNASTTIGPAASGLRVTATASTKPHPVRVANSAPLSRSHTFNSANLPHTCDAAETARHPSALRATARTGPM